MAMDIDATYLHGNDEEGQAIGRGDTDMNERMILDDG
jgi:hypothetical protein